MAKRIRPLEIEKISYMTSLDMLTTNKLNFGITHKSAIQPWVIVLQPLLTTIDQR
ncbi:MAG TPA: hypothetical protein VKA40_04655 [Nitrososphaera sp.]|nr:hypothetical protein [Nitrososphaera sp.]